MFHWCGGLDDILLIPVYVLMLTPGVKLVIAWARRKFGWEKKKKDCCDCHKD